MVNIGRRKLIFGICIFFILAAMVLGSYFLTLRKKPALRNADNQNNKNQIFTPSLPINPSPKFNYRQDIIIDKQGFNPTIAKIKIGTLIKWSNQSGQEVAIASDPPSTHDAYFGLNLGRFPSGSGVSAIFEKAGTYGYYNYLHPEQTGIIVVE